MLFLEAHEGTRERRRKTRPRGKRRRAQSAETTKREDRRQLNPRQLRTELAG